MSEYKKGFELHPETLIEASKALGETEDVYESYLAMEMRMALESSSVDWREYGNTYVDWGHKNTDKGEYQEG